jgi:hypothetical protein
VNARSRPRRTYDVRRDVRLTHEDDRRLEKLADSWGVTKQQALRLLIRKATS